MTARWIRRRFIAAVGAACSLGGCGGDRKPNFVFILIDDLGWSDHAEQG